MTLLALLVSYLIGAFPTGKLIAYLYGVDITAQGSGNIGATNVARTIGKKAGIITLVGDALKGVLACSAGAALMTDPAAVPFCGLTAVLGHCFSIPGFSKGGKGVATSLGVLLTLSAPLGGIAVAAFAAVFLLSHTVSVASLAAAGAVTLACLFQIVRSQPPLSLPVALIAVASVITIKHAPNIRRLIEGTEPKFKSK